jgi:hypothetical protein
VAWPMTTVMSYERSPSYLRVHPLKDASARLTRGETDARYRKIRAFRFSWHQNRLQDSGAYRHTELATPPEGTPR